jgi:CRISPR-associated protein Cmr2
MHHYVLLVTIGPIQDFIASARRCRDLWFGSSLLSELSKAAALGMVEGGSNAIEWLIFPGASGVASLRRPETSVANRILLRLEGDAERVRQTAEAGRRAMDRRLEEIRRDAFDRIGADDPDRARSFHEQTAIAQVAGLMEYLWVAVPQGEGPDAYPTARAEAERLMAARKNTQVWDQPRWSTAGVPKSSLDGVRESVLDERIYETSMVPGTRKVPMDAEKRRRWYGVHGSERLCGVGLLKRHGRVVTSEGDAEVEQFFSTSHLAALPWMAGVESDEERRPKVEDAWNALIDTLPRRLVREEFWVGDAPKRELFGRVDGAVLFENRLLDVLRDRKARPEEERIYLDRQRAVIESAGRKEPIPYYGILVADGDRMGAVIDAQTSFEQHRKLSIALDRFAQEARDLVRENDGSPIYAGGDDVLALLPVHTALGCATELARRFSEHMKSWTTTEGESPTLSAGLALVHHLMPLDEALVLARDAEKIAKHEGGRNALALTVAKRGGTPVTVCGKWDALVPRLESLIRLRRLDAIADRAGHELAELARLTQIAGEADKARLLEIQHVEARRILSRKRAKKGKKELAEQTIEELTTPMEKIGPDALGRELYVAEQLARALDQAGVKLAEQPDGEVIG